jgi:hypothetical protein
MGQITTSFLIITGKVFNALHEEKEKTEYEIFMNGILYSFEYDRDKFKVFYVHKNTDALEVLGLIEGQPAVLFLRDITPTEIDFFKNTTFKDKKYRFFYEGETDIKGVINFTENIKYFIIQEKTGKPHPNYFKKTKY